MCAQNLTFLLCTHVLSVNSWIHLCDVYLDIDLSKYMFTDERHCEAVSHENLITDRISFRKTPEAVSQVPLTIFISVDYI